MHHHVKWPFLTRRDENQNLFITCGIPLSAKHLDTQNLKQRIRFTWRWLKRKGIFHDTGRLTGRIYLHYTYNWRKSERSLWNYTSDQLHHSTSIIMQPLFIGIVDTQESQRDSFCGTAPKQHHTPLLSKCPVQKPDLASYRCK